MGLHNFPLREVIIDSAGAGDIIIIPGEANRTIRVYELFLVVDTDTLLTFKDGPAIDLSGSMSMLASGSIVFDYMGEHPWFTCSDGNDFIINLAPASGIRGRVYYTISATNT